MADGLFWPMAGPAQTGAPRAGPPPEAARFAVPPVMARLAQGYQAVPVWRNQQGGTFTVALYAPGGPKPERYLKWAPAGSPARLGAEAERLRWAAPYSPVPAVLGSGSDGEGSWFISEAIDGESAVSQRWRDQPEVAVTAIGQGLRALHDSLPVPRCPFSWSAQERLARAASKLASGHHYQESTFHQARLGLSPQVALAELAQVPEVDKLVVCHGDACSPNTLIDGAGRWCGHVDFDNLGVADRWADLAVATWSLGWNYGPGWDALFLDAYGTGPDPGRTRYYRLLWDMD